MKIDTSAIANLMVDDLPTPPDCIDHIMVQIGININTIRELQGAQIAPVVTIVIDTKIVTITADCLLGAFQPDFIDVMDEDQDLVDWIGQVQKMLECKKSIIQDTNFLHGSRTMVILEQGHLYEYDESERL